MPGQNDSIQVLTYNIHKGYTTGNRKFMLDSMRQRIAETGADESAAGEAGGASATEESHAQIKKLGRKPSR